MVRSTRVRPFLFSVAFLAAACSPDRPDGPLQPAAWLDASAEGGAFRTVTKVALNYPWGIDIRSDGLGLITSGQTHLGILDVPNQRVVDSIQVGNCPTSVAFHPSGATAYVANQCDGTLGIVDVAARTQVATVPIGEAPFTIAVSPDGGHAYVGGNAGNVYSVNTTTRTVERSLALSGGINGLVRNATGTRLYATNLGATLYEIDVATFAVIRTVVIGGATQGLAFADAKEHLIIANETGFVTDVDLRTGLLKNTALASGGFGVAHLPGRHRTVVTLPHSGMLAVYDESKHALGAPLPLGGEPRRAAIHPGSATLVVSDATGTINFIR